MRYSRSYLKGILRIIQAVMNRRLEVILLLFVFLTGSFFIQKAISNPYKIRIACAIERCEIYELGITYSKKRSQFPSNTNTLWFDSHLNSSTGSKYQSRLFAHFTDRGKPQTDIIMETQNTSIISKVGKIEETLQSWANRSALKRGKVDFNVDLLVQPRSWLHLGTTFLFIWIGASLWVILQESGKLMDRTRNLKAPLKMKRSTRHPRP